MAPVSNGRTARLAMNVGRCTRLCRSGCIGGESLRGVTPGTEISLRGLVDLAGPYGSSLAFP